MADNVQVTAGSGTTVATRDIGSGVEAQRVIPQTYSTPGSAGGAATDVGPGNGLPVAGLAAGGAAAAGNPVLIAGSDGANARTLTTDSSGRPIVSILQFPTAAVVADGTSNPTTALLEALQGVYNGTTWDRARSASAAVMAGFSGLGVTACAKLGNWGVTNVPATATKATISKAAGGAGVRHVATAVTAVFATGATASVPTAPLTVNLIDGATGGGTFLWQGIINVPAAVGSCNIIQISDLALVGTAATAMTLEFSAAGATNTFQSVALSGFDVS